MSKYRSKVMQHKVVLVTVLLFAVSWSISFLIGLHQEALHHAFFEANDMSHEYLMMYFFLLPFSVLMVIIVTAFVSKKKPRR